MIVGSAARLAQDAACTLSTTTIVSGTNAGASACLVTVVAESGTGIGLVIIPGLIIELGCRIIIIIISGLVVVAGVTAWIKGCTVYTTLSLSSISNNSAGMASEISSRME